MCKTYDVKEQSFYTQKVRRKEENNKIAEFNTLIALRPNYTQNVKYHSYYRTPMKLVMNITRSAYLANH